ncbi:hypothetical protein [Dyadobacter sp. CY261]|nr:hypothetical protein [Dyadobacter sp. CY261]
MNLIDAMHWRYAAKRMTGQAIPQHLVDQIIEAAHYAPSGIV